MCKGIMYKFRVDFYANDNWDQLVNRFYITGLEDDVKEIANDYSEKHNLVSEIILVEN